MAGETKVNKIIFITPTNLGDIVFTLSSLDYLKNKFKEANFTVVTSPVALSLFSNDPRIKESIVYDKRMPLREKIVFFNRLRKQNFDVIIDLHDTAFRWFAPAKFKNPYVIKIPKDIIHLRRRHLYKTMAAFNDRANVKDIHIPPLSIHIDKQIEESADSLMKNNGTSLDSDYIVVSPGARSQTKRWHKAGFTKVCQELLNHYAIVFLGDKNDNFITKEINEKLDGRGIDLTDQTNLLEAIVILKKAKLVICNDSFILHVSSYLNLPILAIFGPTDEYGSGPLSDVCAVARKDTLCSPCLSDDCKKGWLCMKALSPQLVIDYAYFLLDGKLPQPFLPYRRILITRTDRLGDVLLSTPVIKNLRESLPNAYIAVMIQESLEDLLRGNPYLDEVILFDKMGKHAGLINSIRFANYLRKKHFDLALILHPTVRVHLILFFSGIKERIGYDWKWGFLNNHILKHTKRLGQKHESEYTLDFLRAIGITGDFDKSMFMPIYKESKDWVSNFFKEHNLNNNGKVVVFHFQASCPSRLWPRDYYNKLADEIIAIYKANIIYVGSQEDKNIKEDRNVINLTGRTSIAQLASIINHSDLFISNDSGPVHIAVALGKPVISIFGRNQPGLSPKRWGHLSEKSVYLHKNIGCEVCLAHDCKKGFACLKAIDPKEVLAYVERALQMKTPLTSKMSRV